MPRRGIAKQRKMKAQPAEVIWRDTHFSKQEVEALLKEFHRLTSKTKTEKLDRSKFRDVLHNVFNMTDDIVMDRVFRAFDKDNDSFIGMEEWVKGLSVFLRGSHEEELKFCFDVYDMNSDGYILREEMFHLLKNSLVKQPTEEDPDEGVKDLVEITLKKMDMDHDTRLSFTDFRQTVDSEPLLLEAFGKCLPDEKSTEKFLNYLMESNETSRSC